MGNHPSQYRRKDGSYNTKPAPPLENDKIRQLKAKASHPLYFMAIFIALSIGAIRDFDFLPSFSPRIHELLGQPPSAEMISAALIVYSFSAIILILSRMMKGSGSYGGIIQVAFLSGFYFFYHFAGAMDDNFWAVFAAGMTILGLESYQVWVWCREEIRIQQVILAELERNRPRDDDDEPDE
ncbi:MAG TPA: menaquinol oxidoreductase [Geobacteraceae bacterium]|nr:menaquinol oxidoreductase [Geobacteraceae bacterium]